MAKHLLRGLAVATLTLLAVTPTSAAILAHYDFQAGGGGNTFDNTDLGLFSVDSDPYTTATRLHSETIDGGGANNIFNNAHTGSASGPPVANWANGHLSEGDANFVEFTITPQPNVSVTYDSLSAFHGSFNASGAFKITYAIGAGPDIEALAATSHTAANGAPLTQVIGDFDDFTTMEPVTWKIHLFGATGSPAFNTGHRLDDILIHGTTAVIPEPSSLVLGVLGVLGLAAWRLRRGRWLGK